MYHVPGIEGLHALRDSLGVIVRAKLPIGRDGRNRPSLFPFGTATGRNAHAKSLYNAHAGMRSFMVFPPDTIGVYLDWRTQEVGVAAALVRRCGADATTIAAAMSITRSPRSAASPTIPIRSAGRENTRTMRQRMKPLQLGDQLRHGRAVAGARAWIGTR